MEELQKNMQKSMQNAQATESKDSPAELLALEQRKDEEISRLQAEVNLTSF